jgi:hypothetical protein
MPLACSVRASVGGLFVSEAFAAVILILEKPPGIKISRSSECGGVTGCTDQSTTSSPRRSGGAVAACYLLMFC